jgi:hypothetical protein
MKQKTISILSAVGLSLAASSAYAVPPIPEESGWRGHVNVGLGVGTMESNMIHGISSIDLGKERISSLEDGPDSENFTLPVAQFEVTYTLGQNRTQFYLGNQVADALSFDLETTLKTHLGIRQEVPGVTRLDISLSASSLPLDVWKDPYVVDEKRGDTERTAAGLHFALDEIFDTGFELKWSATEVEIDDERSGEALGLSRAEQNSLDREGEVYRATLSYDWKISEQHRLEPSIGWVDKDLDGAAMAEDGLALMLMHMYHRDRWRFVSRVFYQDLESDARNPIFGTQGDVDKFGGTVTVFYSRPFGLEKWTANATLGYQDADSNIDFYDSTIGLVSFGMFYRFN